MGWNDISSNQTVSYANLQDAVNQGLFTLSSALPTPSNKQTTKAVALQCISGLNPNYPFFSLRQDNELITKESLQSGGTFKLDPQYGKIFTAMSGTSTLPSFTFNVTSLTTRTYTNKIDAQNIYVVVSGTAVITPVRVSLYVDSLLIETRLLSNTGTDGITLTLPNDVNGPSEIRIAINTGSIPPSTVSFTGIPIRSTAISKTTGQYQIAAASVNEENEFFQRGYLYVSSNYGATWVQKSIPGYWYKVAISDNGLYCLAVGTGEAWKSSNSGDTWTRIINFPSPAGPATQTQNFTGAALSANGQYQTIVTRYTPFPDGNYYAVVYTSSDYGATWTARNVNGTYTNVSYTSVSMSADGVDVMVGYKQNSSNFVYESSNYGVSWYQVIGNYNQYTGFLGDVQDISVSTSSSNGISRLVIATFSNYNFTSSGSPNSTPNKYIYYRDLKFAAITPILSGSPSPLSAWYGVATLNIYNASLPDRYGYAISKESRLATSYIRFIDQYTVANTISHGLLTSSGLYRYRSVACSGDGMYILAGFRDGLRRSTDGGVTWANL